MPSLVRVQPNALLSHRLLSNVQSPLQRGETCCSSGCAPAEFSAVTYRLPFQRPLCSPHVHLALHSGWLSTPGRDSGRLGRARCAKMAPSPQLPSLLFVCFLTVERQRSLLVLEMRTLVLGMYLLFLKKVNIMEIQ